MYMCAVCVLETLVLYLLSRKAVQKPSFSSDHLKSIKVIPYLQDRIEIAYPRNHMWQFDFHYPVTCNLFY